MLEIKETTSTDLNNVRSLWADGDVMKFVGFPDGLHQTDEEMERWLRRIVSGRPLINHYSIYEDGVYCGETFYEIDREHGFSAAMDIKLFGFARGRGIACQALAFAIDEAFKNGAKKVWVDPVPQNVKATALYERLGFERKDTPEYLISPGEPIASIYMELCKEKEGER